MPSPYILDTNAYALLFQNPRTAEGLRLERTVSDGVEMSFYLPEIVSMEIHSVLGKYRRGGVTFQHEVCDRRVLNIAGSIPCPHSYIRAGRKRMKLKVFRDLQKLLTDIEEQRGLIKATILSLAGPELLRGKDFLMRYADKYSFGSHDAIVAATLVTAKEKGLSLTLVTSDKGLKALCNDESLSVWDPNL